MNTQKLNTLLVEVNKVFKNKSEFVLDNGSKNPFLFSKNLNVKVKLDSEDWFCIYQNNKEIVSYYDVDDTVFHIMNMTK